MEDRQKPGDRSLRDFTFRYRHPKSDCANSGKVETRTVQAINQKLGRVVAENERVICGNCYQYYNLQR